MLRVSMFYLIQGKKNKVWTLEHAQLCQFILKSVSESKPQLKYNVLDYIIRNSKMYLRIFPEHPRHLV